MSQRRPLVFSFGLCLLAVVLLLVASTRYLTADAISTSGEIGGEARRAKGARDKAARGEDKSILKPLSLRGRSIKAIRPLLPQSPATVPGQSATLLPDGRWFLAGGEDNNGVSKTTLIKDSRTGESTPLQSNLQDGRMGHTATLLPDGKVLIFGGVDGKGGIVETAELFNPQTQSIEIVPALGLAPRAYHTATVLTDGRVLVGGGTSAWEKTLNSAELWNPRTKTTEVLRGLQYARRKHTAALLPNGQVLVWGGVGQEDSAFREGEAYDPETQSFNWMGIASDVGDIGSPLLEASLPPNGAIDVPLESFIALRFSKPLRVDTVNAGNTKFSSYEGEVAVSIVPAESGMLAFIIPNEPLRSGTSYTLTVEGAVDLTGTALPPVFVSITTQKAEGHEHSSSPGASEPPHHGDMGSTHDHMQMQDHAKMRNSSAPDSEEWIPDANGIKTWQSKHPKREKQSPPLLKAGKGVTALSGRVLTLEDEPLANVTLNIAGTTAVTDEMGRFLLTNPPPGRHGLVINGTTASTPNKPYAMFDAIVEVKEGTTNVLPYTIWLPIVDTRNLTTLPDVTATEVTATTPRVPGLEIRIPRGAKLRYPHGGQLKNLTVTPIPFDRPPFPLPEGVPSGVLFTLQMHGAKVEVPGKPKAGLRIFYPNFAGLPAGERVDLWNYDSRDGKGWYIYGRGSVTPNGKQVVPDVGVELESMHCLSFMGGPGAPPTGPAPGNGTVDGDPVDLGTGLFVYDKTDLVLPDTIPVQLTRTYRQNDTVERGFGRGATHPYDMHIVGDTFNHGSIVLPDGGLVKFNKTPGGYYEHTATPTRFYKAQLRQVRTAEYEFGEGWEVKLQDGTIYGFFLKRLWGDIFGTHVSTTGLGFIKDRHGNKLTITRDSDYRMSRLTTPNNRWIEFTYDGTSQRITQAKDSIGRTVTYNYDGYGQLRKVTDAGGGITEYTYDSMYRMLSIKDARGITFLTNEYDYYGAIKKQTLADDTPNDATDNPTYQFAYTKNTDNKIVQTDVTDPRGNVRRVTFNAKGYTLTDTLAVGRAEQRGITYTRLPDSNLVGTVTDANNRQTTYQYDDKGNLTEVVYLPNTLDEVKASYTYEPKFNQLASVIDPMLRTTTFEYDDKGNLIAVEDPLDHRTTYTYNDAGQVLSVTDALQQTTSFTYEKGDLVSVTDPLGRVSTRYLDAAGRLTRMRDGLGSRGRLRFDKLNQITSTFDPRGQETKFGYDPNGNLLKLTDSRGKETAFTYDALDRVASRHDPLGKVERYGYDKGSNLTEFTDRRGTSTAYRYDALGRLTFVGYAQTGSGAGASHESSVTYAYDVKNRLETVADSQAGTMTFGYDALDRLTSETTPQGVVTYGFDKAGRRVRMQVTGQPEVTYGYDDADRMTQITQGGATVGFGYDAADRRSSMTLPNGVSVEYGYDAASQLTALTYKRGQTTIGDLSYEYDAAGRRTQVGGSFARTGLPEAVTGAVYDDANRLTSRGAQTFTYDDNGNLTSDGQLTYTWDARNRLTGITGATQASFSYDAFGRRVGKAAGGQSTGFLYDGANIVQQQGSVISNVIAGAIDENLSCGCGTNGAQQSFLADAQGSTVALTDANGNIESQYTYEPFGATTQAGATSSNAAKYTGREDDGAGLYYYRARYYSPQLQRFLSEDGAGFGAGDANLYAYTSNDPINRVDPSGNIAPLLAACAGGALFDAGMYVGLELLSGRKPSWSGAGSAALIGCGSGMAGFGIAKAVAGIWRGVKAAKTARYVDDAAEHVDDIARDPFLPDEYYKKKANDFAPGQSTPYNTYERFDEFGNIKQVTTYDKFGDRIRQYDIGPKSRHGEGVHTFNYSSATPRHAPGGGVRNPEVPLNDFR